MRAATLLVLAVCSSALAEPAIVAPKVLVTSDRRQMEVKEYHLDGPIVRATGLDGTPLMMRAEKVDLVESDRISALRQAMAEETYRKELKRQAAEEQARLDAEERKAAAANAAKLRPKRGSMNTASDLGGVDEAMKKRADAEKEAAEGSSEGTTVAEAAESAPASSGADLKSQLRSKERELESKRAARKALQVDENGVVTANVDDMRGVNPGVNLQKKREQAARLDGEISKLEGEVSELRKEIDEKARAEGEAKK